MEIAFVIEPKKQVRGGASASRDPTPASLPVPADELRPLVECPSSAIRWRRARAAALQFSILRAFAGCDDSCLRPARFRATNGAHPAEARGHFSRAGMRRRWRGFRFAM